MSKVKLSDLEDVLSDEEKDSLQEFLDKPAMIQAVKKALLFDPYYNGVMEKGQDPAPSRNYLLGVVTGNEDEPDEVLGRLLRTSYESIRTVELAFKELEKLRKVEEEGEDKENPAV